MSESLWSGWQRDVLSGLVGVVFAGSFIGPGAYLYIQSLENELTESRHREQQARRGYEEAQQVSESARKLEQEVLLRAEALSRRDGP